MRTPLRAGARASPPASNRALLRDIATRLSKGKQHDRLYESCHPRSSLYRLTQPHSYPHASERYMKALLVSVKVFYEDFLNKPTQVFNIYRYLTYVYRHLLHVASRRVPRSEQFLTGSKFSLRAFTASSISSAVFAFPSCHYMLLQIFLIAGTVCFGQKASPPSSLSAIVFMFAVTGR